MKPLQSPSSTFTSPAPQPPPDYRHFFLLGSGLALWSTWQLGTALGILLGAQIPASWSLEFTLTLTFIGMVVPSLKDRAGVAAAVVAGLAALLAFALPLKLGLVIGSLAGILAGIDRGEAPMILWLTILLAGVATFATRLSFIQLYGRRTFPDWLARSLRFVPPAVLTAIIIPELLVHDGGLDLSFGNFRLLAGIDRRPGSLAHEKRDADRAGRHGGIVGVTIYLLSCTPEQGFRLISRLSRPEYRARPSRYPAPVPLPPPAGHGWKTPAGSAGKPAQG